MSVHGVGEVFLAGFIFEDQSSAGLIFEDQSSAGFIFEDPKRFSGCVRESRKVAAPSRIKVEEWHVLVRHGGLEECSD